MTGFDTTADSIFSNNFTMHHDKYISYRMKIFFCHPLFLFIYVIHQKAESVIKMVLFFSNTDPYFCSWWFRDNQYCKLSRLTSLTGEFQSKAPLTGLHGQNDKIPSQTAKTQHPHGPDWCLSDHNCFYLQRESCLHKGPAVQRSPNTTWWSVKQNVVFF